MNNIRIEPTSPQQARAQAEQYRREIAQTLEALGEKLNHAAVRAESTRDRIKERIDDVEDKLRSPLNWVRTHPGRAIGLGVAAGFLWALRSRSRRRGRSSKDLNVTIPMGLLQEAYLKGRSDERKEVEKQPRPFWSQLMGREAKEDRAGGPQTGGLHGRGLQARGLQARGFLTREHHGMADRSVSRDRLSPGQRLQQSFSDLVQTIREAGARTRSSKRR